MRSRNSARAVGVLALVVALAALPGPLPAQSALTPIRIATPGQDGNAAAFYAADRGFFRAHGLDATITIIAKGGGAANVAAVAGNAVDIAEADLIAIAAAREHGVPVLVLAPAAVYVSATPSAAVLVAKNSPIHSARDLDGKTISVPSLEGPARVATAAWIESNGGHLAGVRFVELAPAEVPAALERGTVDAAAATEPTVTRSLDVARIVARPYDSIAKHFIDSAWFASADWIRANPAAAAAFAAAMNEADRWANVNHGASAEIYQKYSKLPIETITAMPRAVYGESLDVAAMQPLLDAALKYKSIATTISARDLVSPIALK